MKLKPGAIPTILLISTSALWAGFGYDLGLGRQYPSKMIGIALALNAVIFFVWDILRLRMRDGFLSHTLIIRVEILFLLNIISLTYIMMCYKIIFMSRAGYVVLQTINAGLILFIILQIAWFITKKKLRPSE